MKLKPVNSWGICLPAALFFFYVIFQMSFFNAISPELMGTFHINPMQLGSLSSLYFYADAAFLLPVGLLLDQFSNRLLLLTMMGLCVLSMAIFGLTHSSIVAGLCRATWGIGNAFAFLGCMRLASLWFPPKRTALVMGILVTVGMLGGVIAQTPFTLLVSLAGWRKAVVICAGIGFMIWLIMYFFIVDKTLSTSNQHNPHEKFHLWNNLKPAMQNTQNWLCGLYACSLNLPIMLLGTLWGSLYLTRARHISVVHASFITGMIFMGLIIGSPLMGMLSDRMASRRNPMILGALLTLMTILLIIYIPFWSWQMLVFLFFMLGFLSSAQVISYPTVAENNPASIIGTAMSIVAILINVVGALVQPLFGFYSVDSYRTALIIMPIGFTLSLLAALMLNKSVNLKPHSIPIHAENL